MSQIIQFRRGLNINRTGVIFNIAEPAYTTDTKNLFIGDGVTTGGIQIIASLSGYVDSGSFTFLQVGQAIPTSGQSFYTIPLSQSTIQNGNNLRNSYNTIKSIVSPNSNPLSISNRFAFVLLPGTYDLGTSGLVMDTQYIDLIGLDSLAQNTVIMGSSGSFAGLGVIGCASSNISLKNLSVTAYLSGNNVYPLAFGSGVGSASVSTGITLDNVIVTTTGTAVSPNGTINLVNGGGKYNSMNFNRLVSNGPLFAFSSNITAIGLTMTNSQVYGDKLFAGIGNTTFGTGDLFIDSCILQGNSGFQSIATTAISPISIIKNSYISGIDWFSLVASTIRGFFGKIENCHFVGNILNFNGKMKNCYIDATNIPSVPVNLTSVTNALPYYNGCTIVAGNSVSISVSGSNNMTGIFNYCLTNKGIYTGVTGLGNFGSSQFNITDPILF